MEGYSGNAAGRSVRRTFDANGKQTDIQSGRFTADVNLTAEFEGAASLISGTVTKFVSPDNRHAVDPDWSVTLKGPGDATKATIGGNGLLSSTHTTTEHGVTEGTGQRTGNWSATSYGEAGKRPAGINGFFNAHFRNGNVAGAYATRKD